MKNNRSTGNRIYSSVGWFCYIACTIISAILNIYLLSRLDHSWAWFLLIMSLSLEFGKAYILIRANTYKSLTQYLKNCKLPFKKVISKEHSFYGIYILFALLSITASLCFSLTITDKTEQSYSLQKQEISQNISMLEESKIKYDEALSKFTLLEDDYDNEVKKMKDSFRTAQDLYDEAGIKLDNKAKELCLAAGDDPANWTKYRRGNSDYDKFRDSIEYDKIKTNYIRAREDYNDTANGKILERYRTKYNEAKAEFDEKISLYGTIESLKLELSKINKQELETAGSSKCFILLANTFGIPEHVKTIKFIILLFVSLLVELCIWLSSPDLKLDSDLLYSYRNDLEFSNKKDVDKLLKEIKNTNTRFSILVEEKKTEDEYAKKYTELKNEKEELEKNYYQLEKENEKIKDKYSELDRTFNYFTDDSEERMKEATKKILDMSERLGDFEKKDHDMSEIVEDYENRLNALQIENANSINKLADDYKSQLNELQSKNADLMNKLKNVDENKKFTEDDVKLAIKKAKDKSAQKIDELTEKVKLLEKDYNNVFEENSNLKVANKSLERKLENKSIVRSAESELEEMLDNH